MDATFGGLVVPELVCSFFFSAEQAVVRDKEDMEIGRWFRPWQMEYFRVKTQVDDGSSPGKWWLRPSPVLLPDLTVREA